MATTIEVAARTGRFLISFMLVSLSRVADVSRSGGYQRQTGSTIVPLYDAAAKRLVLLYEQGVGSTITVYAVVSTDSEATFLANSRRLAVPVLR